MLQTTKVTQKSVQGRHQEDGLVQAIQELLADLVQLPSYEEAPELYRDWGEEGEFKVQVGPGECAQ